MNGSRKRPASLAGQPSKNKRRSMSRTSHDTATIVPSPTDSEIRYAPINNDPYPTTSQHHAAIITPTESQLSGDHASLAQIRQFNESQHEIIDPALNHDQDTAAENEPMGSQNQQESFQSVQEQPPSHTAALVNQHRVLARTMSQDGNTGTATDEEKKAKKSGNNNNAANEKELRELIETNAHRSLEAIARDVRSAEKTQKAEKAKQLFAMRWLKQYCRQDTESVPRSRVYTYYAQRCGTARVDTLNPASFGKLVRIIFPGIQTRRLGVRGESKYHYVNLALIEDTQPANGNGRPMSARLSVGSGDRGTPVDPEQSFQSFTRMAADSATFPAQDYPPERPKLDMGTNPPSQGRLFADPVSASINAQQDTTSMYRQSLRFTQSDQGLIQDEPLDLPTIHEFLPQRTDMDLADALAALYRTHCTSLVDSVRFVKEKQFAKLLGSFNGTMTVPVSRLFAHANLAPWIRECDRVMYQQIIRFVSQLALQVMPPMVFSMMRTISLTLTDQIHRHFRQYPEHVLQSKLEMATIFCSLLQRLLRVNETAHAAANLLMNDEMRVAMWHDWVRSVRPKRVVESSLSKCGHDEAYSILTAEMRHLLAPLPPPDTVEQGTEFQSSELADASKGDWLAEANPTADTIIERWTMFLRSLPNRFPGVPTRTLLYCIESVGNASLRDITVNVAQSFGAWWTTKVWIDEMMLWMAEMGGFLTSQDPGPSEAATAARFDNIESFLGFATRRSSVDHGDQQSGAQNGLPRPNSAHPMLDFHNMPSFSPQMNGHRHSSGPPTAPYKFPTPKTNKNKNKTINLDFHDTHDDSGIGMSLLADGPPNFSFSPVRAAGF